MKDVQGQMCFDFAKLDSKLIDEPVDCNVEDVVQKFRARSRTGYQKYGVTTERGDLTLLEWLIHLQDELMDATIYVERIKKDIHGAINQAAHKYIHELADMGFLEVPKDGSNGQG